MSVCLLTSRRAVSAEWWYLVASSLETEEGFINIDNSFTFLAEMGRQETGQSLDNSEGFQVRDFSFSEARI